MKSTRSSSTRDRPRAGGSRFDRLVERAWDAYDRADLRSMRATLAQLRGLDRDAPEIASLEWRCALASGDPHGAAACVEAGLAVHEAEPDLLYGRGYLALERGEVGEARSALEAAVAADPTFADAWYELALACEEAGDEAGMRRAFGEVWDLDGEESEPLRIPRERFDALVEEALDLLPDEVRSAMPNVAVIVEERPERWIVDDAPWDPRLLGLFSGPDYARERSSGHMGAPATIHLFQRNIERECATEDEMVEQIRVTALHEVGHWLGLDEDDLAERGLD